MASPFIPAPFMYGDIPGGGQLATIVVANSAPTLNNNQQAVGSFWLIPEPQGSGNLYYLAGFVAGVPQWELISSGSGTVVSVLGTASQITANTAAGVVTLSIPTAFIAPGSITSTTTITAGTGITVTTGSVTVTNGNLALGTAGNKITIATGANGSVGTTAALTAGSIVVANTSITANSLVFFTTNTLGTVTVPQSYFVSARTPGTSFTIQSEDATDTSTVNYWIIN